MRHDRKRSILFSIFIRGFVPLLLLALSALVIYGYSISKDIDKRFSGRLWRIPSTVYSDSTLLYPGQRVNVSLFLEKLEHLGYRQVPLRPRQKGHMHVQDGSIDLFLKDVRLPFLEREGFPVNITILEGAIKAISHLSSGEPMFILELEPEELMRFFGPEREQRRLISITQIPEHVVRAFLAAEDTRYYHHHGFDPWGILRAIYVNLRHGEMRQGGSTITQQLAKNYFLTSEKTFSRKFKEMLLAIVLELMFEKDAILEIYLNEIYFGQKGSVAVNGLGEASYFYFGKPVEELRPDEAALIAGIVRAPNHYSPYVDKERCRARRNQVLNTMASHGWLSNDDFQKAVEEPIEPVGFQTHIEKAPYFIDYLSGQMEALYSAEDLSRLGLSIFTTLDTQVQTAAERALSGGLERLEKSNPALRRKEPGRKLQGAILVIQPKTGYILAMVGGRDYGASQFNRVTQAERQPGSAFKPFIFLAGLDQGFNPTSQLSNVRRTYELNGKIWQPRNFTPMGDENVRLRTALAKSINLATIDLAAKVGMEEIIRSTSGFGFSTPLRPLLSIALGALEVIPLDLARAYCAFAADGMLPHPLSLKEVVDEKGGILERRHMNVKQVISPAHAFIMSSLLRSVVDEGTAQSLRELGLTEPIAGKTGTTNNSRDAWFIGYTPDLLTLVWVGFDDGAPIHGTGASAALTVWADLMKNIPQHLSGSWFRMPPGVVKKAICTESGQPAIPGRCPNTYQEYFLEDHVPTESCQQHGTHDFLRRLFDHAE
ncbi:MAG: PBP1A family penicillin-binding protein [Deltaproteobacteria bacterium]|nr:PBP1A family penicillin-binding protein [Deltaproteobacteria bacterium]